MSEKTILKYLKSKEKCKYTALDRIFEQYLTGELESIIKKYGFVNIEVFTQIRKNANYLQLEFKYQDLVISVEFDDFGYDYGGYIIGTSAETYAKSISQFNYSNNFNVEEFIEKIYFEVLQDKRLITKDY